VDNYRIQHSYFVDRGGREFKAPWNEICSNARIYTPDDKAIQTPNSDTPYSFIGADLRAEPLVLTMPEIGAERYWSVQFVDQYTFNFAYVGSRVTGNGGGRFLLAGPGWSGPTPPGVASVIRSETDFAFVVYRTQLFDPADIEHVKAVQAGYTVRTLSSVLGQPAPSAPPVTFVTPLPADRQRTSLAFFGVLNFVLQFCPAHPSERELRARFAAIGVEAGQPFEPRSLSPEMRSALEAGMADAWKAFKAFKETEVDTGKRPAGVGFGTREHLAGRWMDRMAGAVLGIYGNSREEAMYPAYFVDADRRPTDGATGRYALRFAPGQLPPVNAFWSLTLYELPASLLSANPLNRYLINSPMLPALKTDADGGITLHVQHVSPGPDREANWLPAPAGPFFLVLRLYWPKAEALAGRWQAPPLQRVG
jgi:hypothetical protein